MLSTSPPWRRQGSTNSQIKGRIGKAGRTEDRVPHTSQTTPLDCRLYQPSPHVCGTYVRLCALPVPSTPIVLPRTPSTPLLVHVHRQH